MTEFAGVVFHTICRIRIVSPFCRTFEWMDSSGDNGRCSGCCELWGCCRVCGC